MILEGIVTSPNIDGSTNVAPMGPTLDFEQTRLTLRPFQSSRTFQNLARHRRGVFHVVDDVELLARATIGNPEVALIECPAAACQRLQDTCRWFAFEVDELDDSQQRSTLRCRVSDTGRVRDFWGWNRAKHAVLEAAILTSRVAILPPEQIDEEMSRLRVIVEKTAGDQERRAFQLLERYIRQHQVNIPQSE